ncbi:hypothetical protein ACQ4PT_023433 [Festuca glaucescens]
MAYKNLSDLTTSGQTWNIKVKVIRMWDSINPSTDELISIDMILMDDQGDTMHATIWKNMIDTYKSKINEGSVYVFSNFKVVQSTKYRPISNENKITFAYNTKVKEVKGASDDFSDYYFEFATKYTLEERKEKDKQCSDVIGLLTHMKPIESKITKRNTATDIREIKIMIPEGDKIRITLWGRLAHHLSDDVIGHQTVVIVTSTMVQIFYGLSLKSTSATRLYTNLDIPETSELLRSHSTEEIIPQMMEIDKSTQGTMEEQMFYRRRTIQELTAIRHDNPIDQDFVFTTIATIDRLEENIQWWYMSCDVCNKICTKESDSYYCTYCNKYPELTLIKLDIRYRIRLQISDHTATTSCTLFDEEAKRMLNTSVSMLLDSLDGKSQEVPKVIQQLCGRRLIFRFKLNNKNLTLGMQNYAVKKTFVPDDKLEMQYLVDKEEEVQNNKCQTDKSTVELVRVKEEPQDKSHGKEQQYKKLSTSVNARKRRRRSIVVSDGSEDEGSENSQSKTAEKALPKNKKSVNGKYKKSQLEDEDSDVGYTREITSVTATRRMTRSISNGAKTDAVKCKDKRPKRERK